MKKLLAVVAFLFFILSNIAAQQNLNKLKSFMIGSFNSQEQAEQDTNYYNISLHMYEIWPEQSTPKDFWLYVEQAVAKIQDRPYRQRIYHVIEIDKTHFTSEIYELPNPKEWVLTWKEPEKFLSLKISDLTELKGCGVNLTYKKNQFFGSTNKENCLNNFRGASYATSEVTVSKKAMNSWDRGYNGENVQIWGAEKGPYVFKKLKQ